MSLQQQSADNIKKNAKYIYAEHLSDYEKLKTELHTIFLQEENNDILFKQLIRNHITRKLQNILDKLKISGEMPVIDDITKIKNSYQNFFSRDESLGKLDITATEDLYEKNPQRSFKMWLKSFEIDRVALTAKFRKTKKWFGKTYAERTFSEQAYYNFDWHNRCQYGYKNIHNGYDKFINQSVNGLKQQIEEALLIIDIIQEKLEQIENMIVDTIRDINQEKQRLAKIQKKFIQERQRLINTQIETIREKKRLTNTQNTTEVVETKKSMGEDVVDETLADKNKKLADKNKQFAAKNKKLVDKNKKFVDKNKKLADKIKKIPEWLYEQIINALASIYQEAGIIGINE